MLGDRRGPSQHWPPYSRALKCLSNGAQKFHQVKSTFNLRNIKEVKWIGNASRDIDLQCFFTIGNAFSMYVTI